MKEKTQKGDIDLNFKTDLSGLDIQVFASRQEMGTAAGAAVEATIERLLTENGREDIRMIFAAAPSQRELLNYLSQSSKIDWSRIIAFHMDEYVGLPKNAPQSFGNFLSTHLFNKVRFKEVHLIDPFMESAEGKNSGGKKSPPGFINREIKRYAGLLTAKPIDIVCLGIGENGHIAFNDPPVADFKDPEVMKLVELELSCRQQQVNDGMFAGLKDVPKSALTLTIPTLLQGQYLFCVVPGSSKQKAVFNTLYAPIQEDCPATILRKHVNCRFYFDHASYGLISR